MKTKSIIQLLIPFGSTILLFIVFWLLSFVIWIIGYLLFGLFELDLDTIKKILENIFDFLQVNIFQYSEEYSKDVNVNTVVFWILNFVIIIIGELWTTSEDFD